MNELLPCPFCGEMPILIEEECVGGIGYQIKCNNVDCWIGAYTSFYSDKSTTITAWNTRTKESVR